MKLRDIERQQEPLEALGGTASRSESRPWSMESHLAMTSWHTLLKLSVRLYNYKEVENNSCVIGRSRKQIVLLKCQNSYIAINGFIRECMQTRHSHGMIYLLWGPHVVEEAVRVEEAVPICLWVLPLELEIVGGWLHASQISMSLL